MGNTFTRQLFTSKSLSAMSWAADGCTVLVQYIIYLAFDQISLIV